MRFKEFWPVYLRAHSRPSTRAMHYLATGNGASAGVLSVALGEVWIFPSGIALSYAMAVLAHWIFERNQPLILVHALWGAVSDLRMCWLALTGGLADELVRHGVRDRYASVPQPVEAAAKGLG